MNKRSFLYSVRCAKRIQTSVHGQCDNYNLKSHRRCNNMSRMNLSGYVGHVTIFS